jgi:hypothetical protein
MARLERLTVQLARGVRAEIESAAAAEEISAAAVMRKALRDWAIRRQVERARREGKA